jgi:hypothetical protein
MPALVKTRRSANWKLPLQIAQHARGGWPEQVALFVSTAFGNRATSIWVDLEDHAGAGLL